MRNCLFGACSLRKHLSLSLAIFHHKSSLQITLCHFYSHYNILKASALRRDNMPDSMTRKHHVKLDAFSVVPENLMLSQLGDCFFLSQALSQVLQFAVQIHYYEVFLVIQAR